MILTTYMLKKIKEFSMIDFAIFKTYLFGLGLIVGAYAASFVQDYVIVIATIVIFSLLWTLTKLFRN